MKSALDRRVAVFSQGLMLAMVGALASGCGAGSPASSSSPFFLGIANLDGPTVEIEVNDRIIGTVACQLSGADGPTYTPGPELSLPWRVRVLGPGGEVLGTFQELGERGPRTILIRDGGVAEMASDVAGGGALPVGTCPP
ncbi:MAG: hypothetical protein HY263_06745 [Chloroflexi bacterium]|nr:hypothetical protein [Chloroflexota bacterium]